MDKIFKQKYLLFNFLKFLDNKLRGMKVIDAMG
jgi:hypothetical protein